MKHKARPSASPVCSNGPDAPVPGLVVLTPRRATLVSCRAQSDRGGHAIEAVTSRGTCDECAARACTPLSTHARGTCLRLWCWRSIGLRVACLRCWHARISPWSMVRFVRISAARSAADPSAPPLGSRPAIAQPPPVRCPAHRPTRSPSAQAIAIGPSDRARSHEARPRPRRSSGPRSIQHEHRSATNRQAAAMQAR